MSNANNNNSGGHLHPQPPAYNDVTDDSYEPVDYGALTPTTNGSTESLPKYEAAAQPSSASTPGFQPTRTLQVRLTGGAKGNRPDPVLIFETAPNGEPSSQIYTHIRQRWSTQDAFLARADDTTETPLSNTMYDPKYGAHKPPTLSLQGVVGDISVQQSKWNLLSRKTTIDTPFGHFRWRYGSSKERKTAGVPNMLILEKSSTSSSSSVGIWTLVGQFLRGDAVHNEGARKISGVYAGELKLDLRQWSEGKGSAQQLEVLALTSCLSILQKEAALKRQPGSSTHTAMMSFGGSSMGSVSL